MSILLIIEIIIMNNLLGREFFKSSWFKIIFDLLTLKRFSYILLNYFCIIMFSKYATTLYQTLRNISSL